MKIMASTIASLILAVTALAGENSRLAANLMAGKPQTIVTYGTSLTDGAPWVGEFQQVLKAKFPGLATVINSGGSGQWSQWGVSNLDARVIARKPDTVFMEFGINDAVLQFNCTVDQSRSNLTTMIDRIVSSNPDAEIILMTMNPAIGNRASFRPKLSDYYQMYRDVAKERKLQLIDHNANWELILQQDRARFSRYVPDDLHPGPEGCRDVITPAILKALGINAGQPVNDNPPKIPICIIIDDGAPFSKVSLAKSGHDLEVPTSFYREFGEWAQVNGVKGKFSVIPCYRPATACIDGSLGEYPGHSREERLEWIAMIKTVYMPRWTITPEMITHSFPWDMTGKQMLPNLPKENVWLSTQSLETQTEYIAESMRMLKNAGITSDGLTMCFSYPANKNQVLGEATLRAAEEVLGLKFVMIFNDSGEKPGVIYKRADQAAAVSIRPNISDVLVAHGSGGKTETDIERDADAYISADGSTGLFVTRIRANSACVIFNTHIWGVWGNGTKSGFEVLKRAVERLDKYYGDRLQWMTGLEICKHFEQQETDRAVNGADSSLSRQPRGEQKEEKLK